VGAAGASRAAAERVGTGDGQAAEGVQPGLPMWAPLATA